MNRTQRVWCLLASSSSHPAHRQPPPPADRAPSVERLLRTMEAAVAARDPSRALHSPPTTPPTQPSSAACAGKRRGGSPSKAPGPPLPAPPGRWPRRSGGSGGRRLPGGSHTASTNADRPDARWETVRLHRLPAPGWKIAAEEERVFARVGWTPNWPSSSTPRTAPCRAPRR